MSCCGDYMVQTEPLNEKQEGDVLAMALWRGNREEHGRISGRRLPRMAFPKRVWLPRADIEAARHLWQEVIMPQPLPAISLPPIEIKEVYGLEAITQAMVQLGIYVQPAVAEEPLPRASAPNFGKVARLAKVTRPPIFVSSRQDYPSYGDFWQLVEVSGFERRMMDDIDLGNPDKTYIFVAPDAVPDCSQARARCIFWQLEYQGDYTQQANKDTIKEQWSSDPYHARQTGARFVLLGSHPALNPESGIGEKQYAAIMLAYMTARRQAIKDRLGDLHWPPDYPGHNGGTRHIILRQSKLMIHVHQHDQPALSPLRYALAAAYRLPLVVENPLDRGVYADYLTWAEYEGLPDVVRAHLDQRWQDGTYADAGDRLYDWLCIENRFDKVVERELGR